MDRILRNVPATITATFTDQDGEAIDPGVVTVTVTRADGTTLTSGAAAGGGQASRTFVLTAAQTALLDNLTATWISASRGTVTTHVQVVGGFVFTIAQARAALNDSTFDAEALRQARTRAEQDIENALNYALVPRFEVALLDLRVGPLRLRNDATALRFISVAGVAWSSDQLTTVSAPGGFLTFSHWPATTAGFDLTVGYERGLQVLPPGASDVALAIALDTLSPDASTGIDPRAESVVTVDGTVNLRASSGQFSALGVNEWIRANRRIPVA